MFKCSLFFVLLAGCVSHPAPVPKSQDVCATLYDPHLCLITIDSTSFAGHGQNKCLALKNLKKTLIEHNHNPLLIQRAECGRVFE